MKTIFSRLLVATAGLAIGCASSATPTYCGDAGFQAPGLVCEQWLKALRGLCGTDGGCLYDGGTGAGCDLTACPGLRDGTGASTDVFCLGGGNVAFAAICNPVATIDLGLILDAGSCQGFSASMFAPPVCDGQFSVAP